MTTAEKITPSTPESSLELNSLDQLANQFQGEIDAGAANLGFGQRFRNKLKEPKVLAPIILIATTVGFFTPGFIEGLALGKEPLDALVYSVGTTLVTKTSKVYDITPIFEPLGRGDLKEFWSLAKEALPKYTLESRRFIYDALLFGGVVTAIQSLASRSKKRQTSILEGRAIIDRRSEQMFLMAGEGSNVADILTLALGEQALPILENQDGANRILHSLAANGNNGSHKTNKKGEPQAGLFVNLDLAGDVDYLSSAGWNINLSKNNLLQTQDGKNILVTWGMGETNKEPLPLRDELGQDLTVAELVEGTKKLEAIATNNGVNVDETITVYLGNARLKRKRHTGSGWIEITDRDAAQGVDIFIDTREPIIAELKRMLGGEQAFAFETSRADYVDTLIEAAKPELEVYNQENPAVVEEATAVVYEENVADTVQAAKKLKTKYNRVISLTPTLEAHERALEEGVESLCIPLIYTQLLLGIKEMIRNGVKPEQIQAGLDERFPIN